MSRRYVALLITCAIALTVLFTWPLAARITDHVPGRSVDAEQFLWSYWWFGEALQNGQSPFWTTMLYFPEGTSLRYHTTNTLHALVSIPLQALFGLVPTFNLIGLAIFVGTFLSTAWLAYDVSDSRVGALFAGTVFAFAPTTLFHWQVGQYNMLSVEFLPLYILSLRRALLPNQERPLRWVLVAAAAFVAAALCDWQFVIYLGLFSLCFVAAVLYSQGARWRPLLLRSAAIGVIAVAALLPFVLPMIGELQSDNPYMLRKETDTIYHSADVVEFFVPNPASPIWGEWATARLAEVIEPGIVATVVSVSYVLLAFALVGAVQRWRQARFWVLTGVIFWAFSLGPRLKWFGTQTDLPLPYALLFQLKIVQVSRFPARFFIITLICLAVVAALGVGALLAKRGATRNWVRQGVVGFGALLLLMELLPAPRFVETLSPAPSFYTDGTLNGAGAIIEQPNPSNRGMYFQTLHGRPVVWGELSRDNPVGTLLAALRAPSPADTPEIFDNARNWQCAATTLGITHWVRYPGDDAAPPPNNAQLVRDEPQGALYALADFQTDETCFWLATGFQATRALEDGTVYRWTGQTSQIGLLRRTPERVELRMDLHCFAGPRMVRLSVGETVVAEQAACNWPPQPLAVSLDLQPGWTWVELSSVEPANNPADFGYEAGEPVAIAVSKLSVVPLR